MRARANARRIAIGGAGLVLALGGALAATGAAGGTGGTGGTGHGGHHGHHKGVERVVLQGVDGKDLGWITLRQSRDLVTVSGWVRGLTPGFHGFHIHEFGVCDAKAPAGPFSTAGGHYQGGHANHGDHAGDMPSLLVTDEGRAFTQFVTDRFTLADLRDADGSAVMVHGGRDNFANIPTRYLSGGVAGPDATTLATGDAGARVACGVID